MPKIIQIPGRSGFYLRVAVPRGKLRDAFGTCDVVKKIGNTKEEAEENISSAEIAIFKELFFMINSSYRAIKSYYKSY